ncbi:MAG: thioesterase domain-containing protein, partial [Acidobacteriota bacterium]
VSLVAQIKKYFQQEIPLITLFQEATIENLAALLNKQTSPYTSTPLVSIQPSGSTRPFFCVHPIGGSVFCYIELARHLGKEQPVYGLQACGLNGEQKPFTSIEEMATYYIESLRTIQPQGPYLLGGWSLGGLIAFEMAQQLCKQGEEIALLALFDSDILTPNNKPDNNGFWSDDKLVAAFAGHLFGGHYIDDQPLFLGNFQKLDTDGQLNFVLEKAKAIGILPTVFEYSQLYQLFQVYLANFNAMQNYLPKSYSGDIKLFQANESRSLSSSSLVLARSEIVSGEVDIKIVPGNH